MIISSGRTRRIIFDIRSKYVPYSSYSSSSGVEMVGVSSSSGWIEMEL